VSASFGGLNPVLQSCVADVSSQKERPKYLGRIMATFGLGFVLGPLLNKLLVGFSTREKIGIAGLLPFTGFIIALIFFKETKRFTPTFVKQQTTVNGVTTIEVIHNKKDSAASVLTNEDDDKRLTNNSNNKMKPEVMLLVLNGFLVMYAFGVETIYAMFIQGK
jgi:MFS family permease